MVSDFEVSEDGKLSVYIDNSSSDKVYFDEFIIERTEATVAVVVQENHYYPFGMNMKGIEELDLQSIDGTDEHRWQYNAGTEKTTDFGLNWYETPFRGYDNQLGRFHQIDLLSEEFARFSGYVYSFNNPIYFNDPSGLAPNWEEVVKDALQNGGANLAEGSYTNVGDGSADFKELESGGAGLRKVTITVGGTPNGKTYKAFTYPTRDGNYYEVPVYTLTVSGTDENGNTIEKQFDVLRFMPYLNKKNSNTGYRLITETVIMSGLADPRNSPAQSYNPYYEIHNTYSEENGGFVILGSFMIHDGPDNLASDYGWGAAGCMEVCGDKGFSELKDTIYQLSGSSDSQQKGLLDLVRFQKLVIILERAKRPPVKKMD